MAAPCRRVCGVTIRRRIVLKQWRHKFRNPRERHFCFAAFLVRTFALAPATKARPIRGARGCCFDQGTECGLLDRVIRPALVGQYLFAIGRHLRAGFGAWADVEEAIWDAIGKIAGQPVLSSFWRVPVAAEGIPHMRLEREGRPIT